MQTFYFFPFVLLIVVYSLLVESSSISQFHSDAQMMEAIRNQLESFRLKIDNLEARNAENEAKIVEQENKITQLLDVNSAKLQFNNFHGPLNSERELHLNNDINNMSLISKIGRPSDDSSTRAFVIPTSCSELSSNGFSLNGFYLIYRPNIGRISTVLCDFGNSPVSQQIIGNVDVKTRSIHFYVQRTTSFTSPNSIIRFESVRLNDGGAMDYINGIFTAPVYGLYHFEFSGHRATPSPSLNIALQINGSPVGFAQTTPPSAGLTSMESLSLTVSLWVKAGSQVSLFNSGSGVLFDSSNRYTHFTGWLVEEYVKL